MTIIIKDNIILNIFYKKLNFKGNTSITEYYINNTLNKLNKYKVHPLFIFETSIFNILKPIELKYTIINNKYKFKTLNLYKSISQVSISIVQLLKKNYKEEFTIKLSKELYNLYTKQGVLYEKHIKDLKNIFVL